MKIIYETTSTRVPVSLVEKVKASYEKRKKKEPKLRVIDVWKDLEGKL
ncbi:hypothetical protein NVP1206O_34 [Vibrio phage 1.206.O._10N.222.51.B10]|nr:hypothetical protein NVP1206O_34 [Vibrio phage 1.206.O._10N.222.51.B10]